MFKKIQAKPERKNIFARNHSPSDVRITRNHELRPITSHVSKKRTQRLNDRLIEQKHHYPTSETFSSLWRSRINHLLFDSDGLE